MVPTHIAIIMDGNGRWAASKGLPRTAGHVKGAKNIDTIARVCKEMGVKYLTVYAFSTENWSRPEYEVKKLMELFDEYLNKAYKNAAKNGMQVKIIGNKIGLSDKLQSLIKKVEEETSKYSDVYLQVAINYGSRDEIIRATKDIVKDVVDKNITIDELSEELFSSYLDTDGIPDPDLLIRTSGEERLSNYLLWQLAYSEFYFTNVPWPDFSKSDLEDAIDEYNSRNRRYGKV